MPNRTLCDVLTEMRTSIKVGRIDMLHGLIEEAQTMGNRMEAKLYDYENMGYHLEEGRRFKNKLKQLQNEASELESKMGLDSCGFNDDDEELPF